MSRYDDIINLPYPRASKHKPMPMENRAAQFAPFAALTGYDKAIAETARYTSTKLELSQDAQDEISRTLNHCIENLDEHEVLTINHFVADKLKQGGQYIETVGYITKYDEYEKCLTLSDGTSILIKDILSIE